MSHDVSHDGPGSLLLDGEVTADLEVWPHLLNSVIMLRDVAQLLLEEPVSQSRALTEVQAKALKYVRTSHGILDQKCNA